MSHNAGPKNSLLYRRSNSLSHIPTLKRDSRSSRSKSVTRTDNIVKPKKVSLDQKLQHPQPSSQSIQRTRTTPLQKTGLSAVKLSFGRTSSAQKLSAASSTARSPYQGSSVKKERPVNDKRWVMEQFNKVRRYLEEYPGFDPNVLNNMKPPSLNTFVYICNFLLKELDPRINITIADYKEKILTYLKLLHYPGNISNSVLKTVNTMHAWPQIISVFSWLVDLLTFIKIHTCDQGHSDFRLEETLSNFFVERYRQFNMSESESTTDEINEQFVKRMNAILNIDEEKLTENREKKESTMALKEQKAAEHMRLTEDNKKLQNYIDQKNLDINKFYIEDPLYEKKLENELKLLLQKKNTVMQATESVENNISHLQNVISKQPCTFDDKKEILTQIEDMKYTIELKKDKIEKCMQLRDQYDYQLMEVKRKVEKEVHHFNTSLMEMTILYPELEPLQLRDKAFHQKAFRDEIDARIETKQALELKVNENITKVKAEIDSIGHTNIELVNTIDGIEQTTQELIQSKKEIEGKINVAEEDIRLLLLKSEELKKEYVAAIQELQNKEPALDDLHIDIERLSLQKSALKAHFLQCQKDALTCFENFNQIYTSCSKPVNKTCQNITEQLNARQNIIMEKYKELQKKFEFIQSHFQDTTETDK